MFFSRPSEPRTVLLWSDRWWLAGTGESLPFANVAQAADVLAEHFSDEPKPVRLRLIYQPDFLESETVACPQGDRKTLSAALAAEFPALVSGVHAWSHEPIFAHAESFSTVLHHETEPALVALARHLVQLGLAVDSAWPLVTFLNALPDEWTDSGAITVLALGTDRAVAYRHPKDGARSVQHWHGEATVVEVGQWLGAIFAEDANEPVIVVSADDEAAARLESYVGDEHPQLEWMRLAEALGRHVVLPRYHPAQLLPREPVVTAQRTAIAASIALLCSAGGAAFAFGHDWLVAERAQTHRAATVVELRAEIAHLRENAAEIAALRSLIDGGVASSPAGVFLEKLSATVPPQIALSAVQIKGRDIELSGWIAPSASASVLEDWRSRLSSPEAPWTIVTRPTSGGAFTAKGSFRS